MNTTDRRANAETKCPRCGAVRSPDAPAELCPHCLLMAAAAEPASAPTGAVKAEVPSLATVAAAFPQYEILEFLGRGGMGCVYRARQPHLDRMVALKLLPQALASDPAFTERFTREARALAKLNHPNIVTVYDFGQAGGFCFLLMEYVEGANLRQALRTGGFTAAQSLSIIPRICEALQYAHGEGVLHRDIKPENILLDTRGRVKLVDFGVAKLVGEARTDFTLTATGAPLGTPHYMAPEQLENPSEVDHRADIYSMGVVFYEMLTGGLPLGRFPPPSSKTPLDDRVDAVVFQALEKDKKQRQQSADEVRTQVEGISSSPGLAAKDAGSVEEGAGPTSQAPGKPSSWWEWAGPVSAGLGLWATLGVLVGLWIVFGGHFSAGEFAGILLSTAVPGIAAWVLGGLTLRRVWSGRLADNAVEWARWGIWAWPAALVLMLVSAVAHIGVGWAVPFILLAGGLHFGRRLVRRVTVDGLRAYQPIVTLLGWAALGAAALAGILMVARFVSGQTQRKVASVQGYAEPSESLPPSVVEVNPTRNLLFVQPARGEPVYARLHFQSNSVAVTPPLWEGIIRSDAAVTLVKCETRLEPSSVPGAIRVLFHHGERDVADHEMWIHLPVGIALIGDPSTAPLSLPPRYSTNVWLFRSDAPESPGSMPLLDPAWGIRMEILSGYGDVVIKSGSQEWFIGAGTTLAFPLAEVCKIIGASAETDPGFGTIIHRDDTSEGVEWTPGQAGNDGRILRLRGGDIFEVPKQERRTPRAPQTVVVHGAIERTVELESGKTNLLTDVLGRLNMDPQVRLDRVILRRADGSQLTNNVQAMLQQNHRTADVPLRDGDRIEIQNRLITF